MSHAVMTTAQINATWPGIHIPRYAIDNEIHHRGQGSVHLRGLGIEPPTFHER